MLRGPPVRGGVRGREEPVSAWKVLAPTEVQFKCFLGVRVDEERETHDQAPE
jgi:hypothetical protein